MPVSTRKTPSVRALARRVLVSHTAISRAIHDRIITEGVAIVNGKAAVTNEDLAAAAWEKAPRIPTTAEMIRQEEARRAPPIRMEGSTLVVIEGGERIELNPVGLLEDWHAMNHAANMLAFVAVRGEANGNPAETRAAGDRLIAEMNAAVMEPIAKLIASHVNEVIETLVDMRREREAEATRKDEEPETP